MLRGGLVGDGRFFDTYTVRGENDSVILYVTRTFNAGIFGNDTFSITNVYTSFTSSLSDYTVLMDIPGNSITNGTNTITTTAGDHYRIELQGCGFSGFGAQVILTRTRTRTRTRRIGVSFGGSANF